MVRLSTTSDWEDGMGYWGTFIVTRASRSLAGLPALETSADKIDWHGRGPDGWQIVKVHRGPEGWDWTPLSDVWEGTLRAIMEQSGNPVLATSILDSDCGQLIGYSPRAGRWRGWLQLDCAVHYMDNSVGSGDTGTWWRESDGEIGAVDEDLTDERVERYKRVYDEALERFLAIGPDAEGAAPLAVTWAREAGLAPDPGEALAVLQGHETFVEGQFLKLLTALGIPELSADGNSQDM